MDPAFSRLALGTVQFGMAYGVANTHGKPSFETVKKILKTAWEGGVNVLDTAPAYGDSEEVIGKALAELGLSEKFQIVSKIPTLPQGAEPAEYMGKSLQTSLKRLGVSRLAAALLHDEADLPSIGALKEMVKKGYIGQAGVSLNTQAYAECGSEADCLQVPASLLDHRFDGCFGKADRHVFVRGAYLQGMLLMPKGKIFIPEILERREKLEKLGIPMAELALRYLFSKSGNKSILTGVETLEQMQENIRISRLPVLSEGDLTEIRHLTAEPPLEEICVSPYFWGKYKALHHLQ